MAYPTELGYTECLPVSRSSATLLYQGHTSSAMKLPTAVLFAVALSLQACSGLRPVETETETPEGETAAYPAYESFDPAGYDAQPQAAPSEIAHDVPPRILEGRVEVPDGSGPAPPPAPAPAEPQRVQVEGFRVQVFTSSSRDAAERVRTEAVRWWEQAQPGGARSPEAVVAYRQPYYRVQLGAFATREDADAALALVRRQYPEAFLVPDLVTVMR